MSASLNKVLLIGNLVKDPEIKYIASGAAVTKFRLAVNSNKRDAKPEDALFVDIIAWEKLAETCNTYLSKGSKVFVEGRLSIRSYEDKEKNKRFATEVVISNMQFLSAKSENGEAAAAAAVANAAVPAGDGLDEEIPL